MEPNSLPKLMYQTYWNGPGNLLFVFIFFFNFFFFFAALGPSCSMWDTAPRPGIEPGPPALAAQSLSHWTTREVPRILTFILGKQILESAVCFCYFFFSYSVDDFHFYSLFHETPKFFHTLSLLNLFLS